MKKIAVILAVLLPMLAIGQGTTTIRMKRVFIDTLYLTKAVTDTSTLFLAMDPATGKIYVNRVTAGTDYWTVATSLLQKIDTTTGLNIYTGAGADYSYIAQTANGQQVRATTIKRATGAGASVVLNNNPGYVNLQGTDGTHTDQIQVNQGLGYLTGLSSKNANNRMNLGTSGVPWGKLWIDSLNAAGIIRANGGNSDLWNTAYGWGNHAGLYAPISTVSSQWVTSGANIYYNSGNVGILVTNPTSYNLQVGGTIYGTSTSSNAITGTSTGTGIGVVGNSATGYGLYGNITGATGYGVYGNVSGGYGIYGNSTSSGLGGFFKSVSGTGARGESTSGTAGYFTSSSGTGLFSKSTTGNVFEFTADKDATKDSTWYMSPRGAIGFSTTNPATALDMGTGTLTAPSILGGSAVDSKVTIQSTSGAGTAGAIAFQVATGTNGATKAITVLNDGKVGIGTAAPGYALDVSGGTIATSSVIAISGNLPVSAEDNLYLSADNNNNDANRSIIFGSNGTTATTEFARFTEPNGNLGVGTTAPAYKLDVSGTARVTAIAVSTTDTTSVGYPVGTIQMRITAADTSAWLLIRTDGSITARWKKLTP